MRVLLLNPGRIVSAGADDTDKRLYGGVIQVHRHKANAAKALFQGSSTRYWVRQRKREVVRESVENQGRYGSCKGKNIDQWVYILIHALMHQKIVSSGA